MEAGRHSTDSARDLIPNADIKIVGYGPEVCPHCDVYVGHSYWTHRALIHSALNPSPPRTEGKTKKKAKKK